MGNYPIDLRNYLFALGIFAAVPTASEGTFLLMAFKPSCISKLWRRYFLWHFHKFPFFKSTHLLSRIFFQKAFSQGSFGGLDYVNFMMDELSLLNITSLERKLVEDQNDCGFACLEIPSCISYNVADINGKLLCELLPSDKYNNSDKFIRSQYFHHFSIPVSRTPNLY